ncbi:endochitinase [Linderina pennispora]|uniref:Endochitinase n=1 Tax=Linderina pennispora TaxID=61395 RepID=A0A1Y1WIC0_9FUNG|nr:endochitinase [Linderina pennispora]ORX73320.1 endochitinase [Linderina pennispora]
MTSLSLLAAALLSFVSCSIAGSIVFGYLPTWQLEAAKDVDISRYTHVTIAFAEPSSNGTLEMDNRDSAMEWVPEITKAGAQALVSVGGWTGSKHFSPIMKDAGKRAQLIDNIVSWVKDYELNGIDIDYEYPGRQGDTCHPFDARVDTDNFLTFLTDLRSEFSRVFNDRKLITLATRFQPFDGPNGPMRDVSDFASTTGPNAPFNHEKDKGLQYSFTSSIKEWVDAGIPAEKILAGLPFYGRTVTAQNDLSVSRQMYAPLKKESDKSCGGPKAFSGVWKYSKLRGQAVLSSPDVAEEPWIRQFDKVTKTPWLFNTDTKDFVSYDDPASIMYKCKYVKDNGLGGVMVWSMTNDFHNELVDAISSIL